MYADGERNAQRGVRQQTVREEHTGVFSCRNTAMDGDTQLLTETQLTARQRAAELLSSPRNRQRLAIAAGLIFLLLAARFVMDRAAYVSTSDARIAADMIAVSTDISGRITSVAVSEGDRVAAGDVLYTIDDREAVFMLPFDPDGELLELSNPISEDMAAMRRSLLPGLVRVLGENVRRQQDRIRLFELGTRFLWNDGALEERLSLAGLAWGPAAAEQWGLDRRQVDFFDVKADLEALLALGALGLLGYSRLFRRPAS